MGNNMDLELLPCFGEGQIENKMESFAERLLQQRVEALEERLEQMMLSRRVLMRILEQTENERKAEVSRLVLENRKLKLRNQSFAHSILEKNRQIVEMEKL